MQIIKQLKIIKSNYRNIFNFNEIRRDIYLKNFTIFKDHEKSIGFSLIEILSVIAIISIIVSIAIPSYKQHIIKSERINAKINLSKLALALEQYYIAHDSYQNANLQNLHITSPPHYTLNIVSTTDFGYIIIAQAQRDTACATLSLNSKGEKSFTGTSILEECWS